MFATKTVRQPQKKEHSFTAPVIKANSSNSPRYRVGHPDHIKAFADPEAAERWFKANDPEGVAFEYEVLE
jgi:hypothetical protein